MIGGSSGLGKALVNAAIANDVPCVSLVRDVRDEKTQVHCDLMSDESIRSVTSRIRQIIEPGKIKVVVVCAAEVLPARLMDESSGEQLRREFQVNTIAPVQIIAALRPLFSPFRANVYLLGSASRLFPMPYLAGYAASKCALVHLASSLRYELSEEHVSISIVEPPALNTPIWSRMTQRLSERPSDGIPFISSEEMIRALRAMEGLGRSADRVAKSLLSAGLCGDRRRTIAFGYETRLGLLLATMLPMILRQRLMAFTIKRAALYESKKSCR